MGNSVYTQSDTGVWATDKFVCNDAQDRIVTGDFNNYCIFNNKMSAGIQCSKDPLCIGYIVNQNGNKVQLTRQQPVKNSKENGTFYKRNVVGVGVNYNKLESTDYPTHKNLNEMPFTIPSGNDENCKTLCSSMNECKGYVTDGKQCWFKDESVANPTYAPNFSFYYRGVIPPGGAAIPPSSPPETSSKQDVTQPPTSQPPASQPPNQKRNKKNDDSTGLMLGIGIPIMVMICACMIIIPIGFGLAGGKFGRNKISLARGKKLL